MPFFVFVSLFNILISRLHIRFSPLVNSSSSLFFSSFFSSRWLLLVTIAVLALASSAVTWCLAVFKPGACSSALILEYCSRVEIELLAATCPAETRMQMKLLEYYYHYCYCYCYYYFHHMSTASVLYLLFTGSSSAAHHVVKNRKLDFC